MATAAVAAAASGAAVRRRHPPPVTADTTFAPVPLHFRVPHGVFLVEATACAVDSADELYVFNRGNVPVLVFNAGGDVVRHWGNATPWAGTDTCVDPYGAPRMRWRGTAYVRPHAVRVDADDHVWLVDDGAHAVTKCDRHGRPLMMLLPGGVVLRDPAEMAAAAGAERRPAPAWGGAPFNRPTDVAFGPHGDIFVTDGYGNARVHRFAADGRHVEAWGAPGTDPGCFTLPHNAVWHDGALYVADRENSRVQAFDADGALLGAFHAHRAVALASAAGQLYVAEHGAATRVHRGEGLGAAALDGWTPNIGHRVVVLDTAGAARGAPTRAATLGAPTPGERPGQLNWPHAVAVDSTGAVYAAEVSFCECGAHQAPHAREMVSLRKWARGGTGSALASAGSGGALRGTC